MTWEQIEISCITTLHKIALGVKGKDILLILLAIYDDNQGLNVAVRVIIPDLIRFRLSVTVHIRPISDIVLDLLHIGLRGIKIGCIQQIRVLRIGKRGKLHSFRIGSQFILIEDQGHAAVVQFPGEIL